MARKGAIIGAALAAWAALACRAESPAPSDLHDFSIPSGYAIDELTAFALQSNAELAYSAEAIEGVHSQAVHGRYSAVEALQRMFAGSGLRITRDAGSGALVVSRPPRPGEPDSAVAPSTRVNPQTMTVQLMPFVDSASPGRNEEIVALMPFEVLEDRPASYDALQSNSLTAFSLDLQRTPATAQVFTRTFIADTQSDTVEQMLLNYSGVVGYNPTDASAYGLSAGDRDGSGGLSVRGFSASTGNSIKRDGFFGPPVSVRSNSGATPTFDLERVEVVEGPQSLLYGAVGGGGVVNAVSKRAIFGVTNGAVSYRFDELGSKVAELDANVSGGPLALRVAATAQDQRAIRPGLGSSLNGFYTQGAIDLSKLHTVIRLLSGKTETNTNFSFKPSLRPFFASGDPRAAEDANYLAATGQIGGALGFPVTWRTIDSLAGWWTDEPVTNRYSTLIVETNPRPWLAAKLTVIYNEMTDWRNTSGLTLEPAGVAQNPFAVTAMQVSPRINYQSQRQKAAQFNLLATGDFLRGTAHSQTLLGGYVNHLGPSFGSSGIDYQYYQADGNWNPIVGAGAADYGRIAMTPQWYPMDGSTPRDPLFQPGQPRLTLNGQNYVLAPRILQSPAAVAPTDPNGILPNNGGGFTGQFNRGPEAHEMYVNLANYTAWFDGRLSTLAGVSFDRETTQNLGTGITTVVPWKTYPGYEVGAIWQLEPGFGAYATLGTAATPAGTTADLYGRPLASPNAHSPLPEVGFKWHSPSNRFHVQLAYNLATRDVDELQSVDTSYLNAINPQGINGRFGGSTANTFVNIDRESTGVELTATAQPARGWRIRFNATFFEAKVLNDVSYPQLYNDQFHTNAAGQVTYQDGTVVKVDPGGTGISTADTAVPLTLAAIGNPASPYYATPDPNSGAITNGSLRTVLTTVSPADGAIATGATGLPLAAIQYPFASPYSGNAVTLFHAGDQTTGYNEFQYNLENHYEFTHGLLEGLSLYADVVAQYLNRAFYAYYPTAAPGGTQVVAEARRLYGLPIDVTCDAGLGYQFTIRKRWKLQTRVYVTNLFNHAPLVVYPQAANGTVLQVVQRNAPRRWSWQNEIDF